jgi:hypothetical protein
VSDPTIRRSAAAAAAIPKESAPPADVDAPTAPAEGEPRRPWSRPDEGIRARPNGPHASLSTPPRAKNLFPTALRAKDVASASASAAALASLLGCPELEAIAQTARDRAQGDAADRLERALGAFALLADAALTMLDYDRMTTGWGGWGIFSFKYPSARAQYLQRSYRGDLEQASRPRQDRSRAEILEAVGRALEADDPAIALEIALIDRFLAEIGVARERSADWKPNPTAIADALAHDALIPLRALHAATAHLDHRRVPLMGHRERALDAASRAVVETIVRRISEGDFEDWRFEHDASRAQLACLSPDQERALRGETSVAKVTRSGRRLKTRDARGLDLLWVTKIGGPSHGFDMLSQCLLPLLANARNGAIIVDDAQHPGAARSTLRLLPTPQGEPLLYLEMLQVDYPYKDAPVGAHELRGLIIEHALEKARAMGVRLVIAPARGESAESILRELGAKGERKALELVLHPSAGVFEASDTLLNAHHRPQTNEETVKVPHNLPFVYLSNPYPCIVDPRR